MTEMNMVVFFFSSFKNFISYFRSFIEIHLKGTAPKKIIIKEMIKETITLKYL